MMLSPHILPALLLSLCAALSGAQPQPEPVQGVLGADCILQCTADLQPGVQYRAVRWYKEGEASRLHGLVSQELPNGTTRGYSGARREVQLLADSRDILLPNVTCADRGAYTCHLAAPVGEQNREGRVVLALRECPSENPLTDTYLVVFATVVLMLALVIFLISYFSLRNFMKDRSKTPLKERSKETLLDAALKPLDEKELQSIYTLGPKASRTRSMNHVCV